MAIDTVSGKSHVQCEADWLSEDGAKKGWDFVTGWMI
jgi:hypothetical protein